jgi:anhydro-N-acetylmuramic acid kinase
LVSHNNTGNRLYIGLMTGTSLDGVDGVLAAIPDHYQSGFLSPVAAAHIPFTDDVRARLMALQQPHDNELEREAGAAAHLADIYARCVFNLLDQTALSPDAVTAIGAHGQTVRHRPERGYTRQVNHPALLAELTGIDVIADFRSRDLAAGGQGAPLVPAFHRALFGSTSASRVIVNIGGMANISLLESDGKTTGFDTGPGNVLLDGWIARNRNLPYDENGAWAASGKTSPELLAALREEPFFALTPPKSTGRDLFNDAWLTTRLSAAPAFSTLPPADIQATLAALTAGTIADAIYRHAPSAAHIFICGGGAKNAHLVSQFRAALQTPMPKAEIRSTEAAGLDPAHIEALAFAWLAHRFVNRLPGNLPEVTGARGPRILGALYPGTVNIPGASVSPTGAAT